MNWLVLTFLAVTSRAVYSIATKLLSKHVVVSPITQAILLTLFATILTLFISPLVGGISFSPVSSLWGIVILMIVSQAAGNILFFFGQKRLDAGNTQIAFSSILVWGAMLSILFLHSYFSLLQLVGITMLLFAIVLIHYTSKQKNLDIGTLFIVGSALLFAVFQITTAQLATHLTAATYLFLAYGGSSLLISLVYSNRLKKDLVYLTQNKLSFLKYGLFASTTSLFYFLFSYFAYSVAPDRGIVVVLLTTQVILSVIFGIIFLKEHQHIKRKLVAASIALLASILIKT